MALLKDITLGQYYPGESFLHRLDPRSKLLASMLLLAGLLISNSIITIVFFSVYTVLGVMLSGIPVAVFGRNLKSFLWFLIFTFLIHLLLNSEGNTLVMLPLGLRITSTGLAFAVLYTTRLVLIVVVAGLLTLSTTPVDFTDGLERLFSPLRRLRVPVHEIALMISLSLRFIPLLLRETERLKNAQISRGVSFSGSLVSRLKSVLAMLLPLFVSAFRRADELAVAMEARYYVNGTYRTSYRTLKFQRGDVLILVLCSLALMILFFDKL